MINVYNNIYSPYVQDSIDIYEFIERVKEPSPEVIRKIEEARYYKASNDEENYNKIKSSLPCYTLSFSFNEKKSNNNISSPTGLMYLDVDGRTDIDLSNNLVFASWVSLSNTGRGVLVKVNNLSIDNFKDTYIEVSKELGLISDPRASKATQYTIGSYDPNLFFNDGSKTWIAKTKTISTPKTVIYQERKRKDNTDLGLNKKLRFSNVEDVDFKGDSYVVFKDSKEKFATVFVPLTINDGGRNEITSSIAYQIRALNPSITKENLSSIMHSINSKRCKPPLTKSEIEKTIIKVMNLEDLSLILNKERRIVFNPEFKMTAKEKAAIYNPILGKIRSKKTVESIRDCLINWDINSMGKVTQKSLARESKKNIKTINKYYKLFRETIQSINEKYKSLKSSIRPLDDL